MMEDLMRFLSILVPCLCGMMIYYWYDRPLGIEEWNPQESEQQHETRGFEGFGYHSNRYSHSGTRSVFWTDQNGNVLELVKDDRLSDRR